MRKLSRRPNRPGHALRPSQTLHDSFFTFDLTTDVGRREGGHSLVLPVQDRRAADPDAGEAAQPPPPRGPAERAQLQRSGSSISPGTLPGRPARSPAATTCASTAALLEPAQHTARGPQYLGSPYQTFAVDPDPPSCVAVRLLREELQMLQEPGSYIGEVIKVMGKTKILVKVQAQCAHKTRRLTIALHPLDLLRSATQRASMWWTSPRISKWTTSRVT